MNETLTGSSDVKSSLHQRGMALLQRVRQFQQKNLKNFIPFYCEVRHLAGFPLNAFPGSNRYRRFLNATNKAFHCIQGCKTRTPEPGLLRRFFRNGSPWADSGLA